MNTSPSRNPICPDKIRTIAKQSFAFIPHRFLRDGFLASLSPCELQLYLFLLLVADRNGLSFYHYDSICSVLECSLEDYLANRNALIDKDLIAFDGSRFQVLSLPKRPSFETSTPLTTPADMDDRDPATARRHLRHAFK